MMYSLLFKNFIRSKGSLLGVLFLLLAGCTSIWVGKQYLKKQNDTIEKTIAYQEDHTERYSSYNKDDIGLLLYYLRFGFINKTENINALSIGQRDVNPSIYSLTILNLENQKYNTDLNNPVNLLLGNLDMGFVIIFLFPLVIIAFTYNVFSEEKEESTWVLLCIQSSSPFSIIIKKLIIRFLVILAVLLTLIIVAILVLGILWDERLLCFILLSVFYTIFWFALVFWVVSWKRSSSISVVSLLSLWVVFTILLPAGINNYIITKYPMPEALDTVKNQREAYHEKWDMAKEPTLKKFYALYPQYEKYGYPKETFSWVWYFAMQQMGDEESKASSLQLKRKLEMREQATNLCAFFVPTIYTQLQFNNLSNSGLNNQIHFMKAAEAFHEKQRVLFYPLIFSNAKVDGINWKNFRPEYYSQPTNIAYGKMFMPFILAILLMGGLSGINLRRKKRV